MLFVALQYTKDSHKANYLGTKLSFLDCNIFWEFSDLTSYPRDTLIGSQVKLNFYK